MEETVAGQSIKFLDKLGIFNVFIAFTLGFAITFGMLEKTKIFGENMRNINMLIAFVIGLSCVFLFIN